MRSVLILCAATWGELGNLNAAQRLATAIRSCGDGKTRVEVQPIEDWCEAVASSGRDIREITATSGDASERQTRYLGLINQLQVRFPARFETDRDFADQECDLDDLSDRIRATDCELIVGTKGFVSRIAHGAVNRRGPRIPVVNYVTNDGLLTLPLHRTDRCVLNLVQTDFGRRQLAGHEKVQVVGPLIGRSQEVKRMPDQDRRPLVCLLCNRNAEYRPIIDMLARRGDAIRVKAIIMGAPELLGHTRRIAPAHWDVWDAQATQAYLTLLDEIAAAPFALLFSKSGPNTVLEAAAAGVPVLVLSSGLPTERWIGELVLDRRLGWSVETVASAIEQLNALIDDPERIAARRVHLRTFAEETIGNRRTSQAIYDALRGAGDAPE